MWQWKEEARLCEIHMWDSKSHLTRFLSLLHCASLCIWDGVRQLLIQQFFNLFGQFKTTTKSHENYVFLYPFSNMAISPQNNEKAVFYTGKLYGSTSMQYCRTYRLCFMFQVLDGLCLREFFSFASTKSCDKAVR